MECIQYLRVCKSVLFTFLAITFLQAFSHGVHLNEFVVRTDDVNNVDNLASKHGMKNLGQVGNLKDYFAFEAPHIRKRSARPSDHIVNRLLSDPSIKWAEQQIVKTRVKRDIAFDDPYWSHQWYLNKGGRKGAYSTSEIDMGVRGAWKKGYTGNGIVVALVDDGIEWSHPDLAQNYDKYASYDFLSGDPDPMPTPQNEHGTRCAGELAAAANNSNCIVGVAYNARIGGIRILDNNQSTHDRMEASSLGYNHTHVDIYSNSWGPEDDGINMIEPGPLVKAVLREGVSSGRDGKGNIFIWAAGNGGREGDSCSCDGYTNSIYTISISSLSQHGVASWYTEECASTMAVAYSSGNGNDLKIASTDLNNSCTVEHTGTSAAVPLVSGAVALALEANPSLTWRDVQHITMLSASMEPIADNAWTYNGVNRKVSHKYGYGLLNATTMVNLARSWVTVPDLRNGTVQGTLPPVYLYEYRPFEEEIQIGDTIGVNYLENVHVTVSLNYTSRGRLSIYLVSPRGTRCTLLPKRPRDTGSGGFIDWDFLSVHFWGENPTGLWQFSIVDRWIAWFRRRLGKLAEWKITFYGTKNKPFYVGEETSFPQPTSKEQIPSTPTAKSEKDFIAVKSTVTPTDRTDNVHVAAKSTVTPTDRTDNVHVAAKSTVTPTDRTDNVYVTAKSTVTHTDRTDNVHVAAKSTVTPTDRTDNVDVATKSTVTPTDRTDNVHVAAKSTVTHTDRTDNVYVATKSTVTPTDRTDNVYVATKSTVTPTDRTDNVYVAAKSTVTPTDSADNVNVAAKFTVTPTDRTDNVHVATKSTVTPTDRTDNVYVATKSTVTPTDRTDNVYVAAKSTVTPTDSADNVNVATKSTVTPTDRTDNVYVATKSTVTPTDRTDNFHVAGKSTVTHTDRTDNVHVAAKSTVTPTDRTDNVHVAAKSTVTPTDRTDNVNVAAKSTVTPTDRTDNVYVAAKFTVTPTDRTDNVNVAAKSTVTPTDRADNVYVTAKSTVTPTDRTDNVYIAAKSTVTPTDRTDNVNVAAKSTVTPTDRADNVYIAAKSTVTPTDRTDNVYIAAKSTVTPTDRTDNVYVAAKSTVTPTDRTDNVNVAAKSTVTPTDRTDNVYVAGKSTVTPTDSETKDSFILTKSETQGDRPTGGNTIYVIGVVLLVSLVSACIMPFIVTVLRTKRYKGATSVTYVFRRQEGEDELMQHL